MKKYTVVAPFSLLERVLLVENNKTILIMKKLTITKKKFLEWYYESGQDQENKDLKTDLANSIIDQMFKTGVGSMSVQELFDGCNKEAIRLSFTEQGTEDDYDIELSDLGEFEIQLV